MSIIKVSKTYRILVPCSAGTTQYSLNNQDFLTNKKIKNIYISGQQQGEFGESPILQINDQFYIRLYRQNRIIVEFPSSMLAFNTGSNFGYQSQNVIDLDMGVIDWQQSLIIFPTNLLTNTNLELIVFYED